MATQKSNDNRIRNFATVVYPESAPSDWMEILQQKFVPAFISPLHEFDKNPTGEDKKPHYHVMLMFEGKKSDEQVKAIFDSIGGVGLERVNSLRGYARYLCHLDNPEKHQYQQDGVRCLCGADYATCIGLPTDDDKMIAEMEEFIDRYNVKSFYLLSSYARLHRTDWKRVLNRSCAIYMREYIKSRTWSVDNGYTGIVDPETGENIL